MVPQHRAPARFRKSWRRTRDRRVPPVPDARRRRRDIASGAALGTMVFPAPSVDGQARIPSPSRRDPRKGPTRAPMRPVRHSRGAPRGLFYFCGPHLTGNIHVGKAGASRPGWWRAAAPPPTAPTLVAPTRRSARPTGVQQRPGNCDHGTPQRRDDCGGG